MANQHPYHMHREHQVAHRRVSTLLKGEASGSMRHATGKAFSAVTSKTAANDHDGDEIGGGSGANRFARGGKVKGGKGKGHQTNIAIVVPHHPAAPPAGPLAGPAGGPPPMAGPGLPPGGPPPGGPPMPPPGMMRPGGPPGGPPGMPPPPMRARGGKIDGESTKADIKKFGKRAASNSYFTGGAATGVGREQKAAKQRKGR